MKRRRLPASSQTLARIPGNRASSLSMTSCTDVASISTISAPAVCFRSGAGITTLSDMGDSFHEFLESVDLRVDDLRSRKTDRLRRLQPIACDCDYRNAFPI